MNAARTIAKNSIVLLISQIITFGISFVITILTARYLGTEGYGILSLATALTGIIGIVSDIGLNTLIIRDVSRNKTLANKFISNTIVIKILLAFLAFFIMILIVNVVDYPSVVKNVVSLVMLSVIVSSFTSIFTSIIQANEKMEFISINTILNYIVMLIGTLIAVYYHLDIIFFATIYLISSIICFIYIIMVYIWKFSLFKFEFDLNFSKQTLNKALTFGLAGIFATIYVWVDTFLLSIMQGNDAVGVYNAAYKLITVLLFIPIIFNTSLFPVFSKFFVSSKNSLKMAFDKYFKFMIMISFPLVVGTTLLANKIILLIFGPQFSGAVVALQILIWSTAFIFLNSPFTQLLQSTNKQMILTKITAICLVINVVLNLIFIPKYSYIGCSIITVITELLVFSLVLFTIRNTAYGVSKVNLKAIIKVLIASILMGIFILSFNFLSFPLLTVLAILLYLLIIYLIGGIDKEDVVLIKKVIGID